MSIVERSAKVVAAVLGVSSVLMILAGFNLLFASWLFWTRQQPLETLFWGVGGVAFIAYAIAILLELARREPDPRRELLLPLLKLGAIALVLAGPAWVVQTELQWRRTGDFEAYGGVIGCIMAIHGIAAFWWLERPRRETDPLPPRGASGLGQTPGV